MSEDNNDLNVNESAVPYERSKQLSDLFPGIQISTTEEQAEQSRRYSMSLSPIERMAYMHQLILIAYAEELKKPLDELWNKTITIEQLKW